MCDTLCIMAPDRAVFAKNSDRPPDEVQLVEAYPRRERHATIQLTHIDVADGGAPEMIGSRPSWMWGFEHGINEHRVAVGNEKIWTIDDPHQDPPSLLGMDLVRLGLERGRSADEALDEMIMLLEVHGQGGTGEQGHDEPYYSSFIVADPRRAWMLETSRRTWAVKQLDDGGAISNRVSLGTDWWRASSDVERGADFQRWRKPDAPLEIADNRLRATQACVTQLTADPERYDPRVVAATLRHHGERPWGAPGDDPADVSPLPAQVTADWDGVTVCMHVRGYQATTSSMITELPTDPQTPMRAWCALGSPCVSVYVPVFPPDLITEQLGSPEAWRRFATLRDRVEADGDSLAEIRSELAPVEAELWDTADALVATGHRLELVQFVADAWAPIDAALKRLGV